MDFHILTTHTARRDDTSPLQLISAELLAHYRNMERIAMKYQPRDWAAFRAARDAAIVVGTPIVPKLECHMCGWEIPKGALWCSTLCAQDHADRRRELTAAAAPGGVPALPPPP